MAVGQEHGRSFEQVLLRSVNGSERTVTKLEKGRYTYWLTPI